MGTGLSLLETGAVAVIGGLVALLGGRAADYFRRRDQGEDTRRALAVAAGQHLRASEHALRVTLTASAGDQPPSLERLHELLARVRDDGVELLAADTDGLNSQLFLSHDAAYDTLREAVQFYQRAVVLRLEGDDFDNEVAVLLKDGGNAVTEYLHTMDQALAGTGLRRRSFVRLRWLVRSSQRELNG